MHKDYVPPSNLDVKLVRGPLTREILVKHGNNVQEKYCDPGVLVPFLYNIELKQKTTQDVLVLLHWETKYKNHNLIKELDAASLKHWDMSLHQPIDIMNEIAKTRVVVSNSLHGIIVAECMGKPVLWLTNGKEGQDKFKYYDYYLGSGRTYDDIKVLDWTPNTNIMELEFTKLPKIDFTSLIETFPFELIDKDILDKIHKYYPKNIIC